MVRSPLSLVVVRRAVAARIPSLRLPAAPLGAGLWPLALLCLTVAAVLRIFPDLDEHHFHIDEGIYVSVTNNMLATGDWINLEYQGTAYLNKPPLYCWITAAILPLTDGGRGAYRLWSALFGVGCVLLTAVLGRRLFGPGVGVLAAMILLSNGKFIHNHGVRSASFDAALTLLGLLFFLLWWDMRERGRRWLRWGVMGVLLGAGFMLKTLGGLPMLGALALYGLVFDRSVPVWNRLAGPLLAVGVACLIAAPWHIIQWQIHGAAFTHYIFWQNYVQRAVNGLDPWHIRGPLFYAWTITESCSAFALALPALGWAAWRSVSGERSESLRLLVVPTAIYLFVFSLSKSKLEWYVYPTFPLIALVVAWLLW
ncbi:MAG TPA: glycosyltransferase family 39 protein, partial [Gemmataceae bacterium]|nr:glycosyltransferase family 39 protein [Gemmataceae bacterium]